MATESSRYTMTITVTLTDEDPTTGGQMWSLSNEWNGLHYDAVVEIQKLIPGIAEKLNEMGATQVADLKKKKQ